MRKLVILLVFLMAWPLMSGAAPPPFTYPNLEGWWGGGFATCEAFYSEGEFSSYKGNREVLVEITHQDGPYVLGMIKEEIGEDEYDLPTYFTGYLSGEVLHLTGITIHFYYPGNVTAQFMVEGVLRLQAGAPGEGTVLDGSVQIFRYAYSPGSGYAYGLNISGGMQLLRRLDIGSETELSTYPVPPSLWGPNHINGGKP